LTQTILEESHLGNPSRFIETRAPKNERSGRQGPTLDSPPYPWLSVDAQFTTRKFLGVNVNVCRRDKMIDFLLSQLARRKLTKVAFANVNLLNQISRPSSKIRLDDFLMLNDGIGLDIGSIILYRSRFPENLNGTDLVPELLHAAGQDIRVFLYGATPDIVERASAVIAEQCNVKICGACDGYGMSVEPATVAERIRESAPDIVLVALGSPKQEMWIESHARELNAPLVIGVGALFDILVGVFPRAPRWIRRARLEWLYRFALEPTRLWRRYTIETLGFFLKLLFRGRQPKVPRDR
jgi:beta-1,4-glucosyltransferase